MESSKIDLFIATYGEKFPPEKLIAIKNRLETLDDSHFTIIQSIPYKDPTTLLIFSIFLGWLSVDRFILGEVGLGILKLITLGGLGLWTFIDWFLIMGKTRKYNFRKFESLAH